MEPYLLRRSALVPRRSTTATRGAHARNTRTALSPVHRANDPVKATFKVVGLRGLEPLTFSLRRHGVDLIRREHGVIDVQVAAAGAPWLRRGGTHGAHG